MCAIAPPSLLAFKGDVEAVHAGFAEATKIGDRGDLFGTRQRGGHVEVLKRDKNTPGREAGETGVSGALMDMETLKQPAPTVLPNPRPGLWTVGKPASSNAGDGWVPAPGMLHLATLLGCPQPSYDR